MMIADQWDAIVIGAGPAGSTAATLLAQAGWSVVVIERKSFPRRKVCGEYLSATNWALFERLGMHEAFDTAAGPEVRRVGLLTADTLLEADLPLPSEAVQRWGRALPRQTLDSLLLQRATNVGATVLQPWRATQLDDADGQFVCRAQCESSTEVAALRAPVVIAAHGSWDSGTLPTELPRRPPRRSDLLGFKAHLLDTALAHDLMPLLSFPGGYGGMVQADAGRTSLSCCLRRDVVESLDRRAGTSAGDAVLDYIHKTTPALAELLPPSTTVEDRWLSAGPIRPGIRATYIDGIYRVGNAAGEAHPVVAEGISMAMQSAALLAERLIAARDKVAHRPVRDAIADDYRRVWRESFTVRIRAAAAVAHWAMSRTAVSASLPFVRRLPGILTWGARLSGKARLVIS
jgi:flavin-dependent dehydrogenase